MKTPFLVELYTIAPLLAEYTRGKGIGYDNNSGLYGRYDVMEYSELVFGELV